MESKISNSGKDYIIDYYWNGDVVYAEVYYMFPENLYHLKFIGSLVLYYNNRLTADSTRPHWSAQCFIPPEYIDDSLPEAIGNELLKNTNCKEPFSVSIYGLDHSKTAYKMWGNIWLD